MDEMAAKLGVSRSVLGAVESGQRQMPYEWNKSLCEIYELSADETTAFTDAVASTQKMVGISIEELPEGKRKVALELARMFGSLDAIQIQRLVKLMKQTANPANS